MPLYNPVSQDKLRSGLGPELFHERSVDFLHSTNQGLHLKMFTNYYRLCEGPEEKVYQKAQKGKMNK